MFVAHADRRNIGERSCTGSKRRRRIDVTISVAALVSYSSIAVEPEGVSRTRGQGNDVRRVVGCIDCIAPVSPANQNGWLIYRPGFADEGTTCQQNETKVGSGRESVRHNVPSHGRPLVGSLFEMIWALP